MVGLGVVTGKMGGLYDGDVMFLKTDGQGNEQWRKTFGEGWGYSVQQTVDGGFIVTGQDFSNDFVSFYSRQMVKGMNSGEKPLGMVRVIRSNKR